MDFLRGYLLSIMEFPTTREKLQNAREFVYRDMVQYKIDTIVDDIKLQVVAAACSYERDLGSGMFPLKTPVRTLQINIPIQPRFVGPWRDQWMANTYSSSQMEPINPWKTHLDVILNKLKDLFPDVRIEIDYLRTYLFFDWT
jgi:hypothetical protein